VRFSFARFFAVLFALFAGASLASAQITLSANTVPTAAQPGSAVSLAGTGYSGTITAANVQVTITPPAGSGSPVTLAAGSITAGTASSRTVQFLIPASLTTSSPLACTVSIKATNSSNTVLSSANTAALTIDPPPTVVSASPGASQLGSSVTLVVTGSYTTFSSNTAISLIGPGTSGTTTISQTGATTYNPATPSQVSAVLNIPAGVPTGSYTVIAKTGTQTASLTGGFLIAAAGPLTLSSITPYSLAAGQSTTVSVVGVNTHFVQGTTVAAFGSGITPGPVTVVSSTQANFGIAIDPIAVLGSRTLTMSTGGEFATGTFTILSNGATLQSVSIQSGGSPPSPLSSVPQGTNATLMLTGSGTHWVQAGTTIAVGGGISVGNITVLSPTSLAVNISVGPGVPIGSYGVTATTNGEIVALANVVSVTAATPSLSTVSPNVGTQGQQHLLVGFTGVFTSFTTTANGPLNANFGSNITVNSITAASATSATADISIDPTAFTGGRTGILSSNGANYNFAFTVNASNAALTAAIPNSGLQGASVALQVTAVNTHWVQGLTSASLGSNIAVNRTIVNSPTTAEVDITIPANAPLGLTGLALGTGGEIVSLNNAFTVLPYTPSLTLSPSSGMIPAAPLTLNTVNVNLSGNFTHFVQGQTIAAIDGNGVAIQNFTVLNQWQATAQFAINQTAPASPCTNAYGGNHIVTLETPLTSGSEIVQTGFCVTSTPAALTSISPYHSAEPASNLSVKITGQYTHFESGVTALGFGPNITVVPGSLTVVNPTTLTASINIAADAVLGWRPVFVNTIDSANSINEQLTIGFGLDAPSSSSFLSVSPNSGIQGQSLTVQITGSNTNWAQGSTIAIFGAGITVNSLTINSTASATAQISIDPVNAPVGGSTVTMVTELSGGNEEIVSGPLFSVSPGIASISFVGTGCPQDAVNVSINCQQHQFQVHQGDILSFTVIGANTHWKQGETTLNFGSDVAVTQLTVVDPNTIQCQIAVAYTATIGFRGVTATTNAEVAPSFSDAIDVLALQAVGANVTPTSGVQGTTFTMQVNGIVTHFTANNTVASFGNNNGVNVMAVSVTSPTQMNLTVQVAGTAYVGPYSLTITTTGLPVSPNSPQGIEQLVLTNVLGIGAGAAIITSVNPTGGAQNTTASISVVGQATNFLTGETTAAFTTGGCASPNSAGINVSNVTATDHTHATLSIAVSATAPTGYQTLCMTTLGESVSYGSAFQVTPGTPTLNQVSPVTGQQGQTLTEVQILGQFTHWQQGVTTFTFGEGITVQSPVIVSATSATVTLVIDPAAYTGSRTTTVTTGDEIVSGSFFSVTPSDAIITSITPANANQGQHILMTINGSFTHWSQELTQFAISGGGGDIAINGVTINSNTQAVADLTISATANLGTRSISMSTVGENVSLQGAFLVTGGIPSIASISPGSGMRGDMGDNVIITGVFTNLVPWSASTVVDFGDPCITVTNAGTFNSQFSLTAVINIGSGASACPATLGVHTVTVRTGTSVQTGQYTVYDPSAPPAPYISYISPGVALAGQTLAVTLAGAYTNWLPGQTSVAFGAGILLNSFQVTGVNSAVANITIEPGTAVGSSTVTITTGTQQLTTSFYVTVGTPAITLVSTNTAIQGETRLLDLVGQYTAWNSTTQFAFCNGVIGGPPQIFGPTAARIEVTVSPFANTGSCAVTATTTEIAGTEVDFLGAGGSFAITPGIATISSVSPNTALQGAQVMVGVTGFDTLWNSSTTFTFGSGIAVQAVVNSPTSATLTLTLDLYASPGTRTLTATTGGEIATLNNAFVVQPGTPLLLSATGGSNRQQSQFSVGLLGQYTNWTQSNTTVAFSNGGVSGVTVNVTGPQSITVTGTVQALASLGCGNIVVTTTGQIPPILTLSNAFCITAGPAVISQLVPNSLGQGQTATIQVTGANTNWQSGVTGQFNFGPGITFNYQNIASPTSASVNITVGAYATPEANTVTVSTLGETASDPSGFTIYAASPIITDVYPSSGAQGQTNLAVAVSGAFTHFAANNTTASFGDFSAAVTVNSLNSLTLSVTIPPTAAIGARTLTITTNAGQPTQEIVTLANAFTVNAGPAVITSVAPNQARRGATGVTLLITGTATHFDATSQISVSGGGFTQQGAAVPVSGSGGLQANVTVNIDPSATIGARNVTMTTGGEAATLANAFTVQAALLSISTTSLPFGTSNILYSQTVATTGGLTPFNFSISAGSLPATFAINSTTGAITGTATNPVSATFTVKVTDSSSQSATASYTINIYNPLSITTASLSAGVSGIAYSQSVAASGGASPLSFAVHAGSLPPNVNIDPNSGNITGTPTATGTFTPTIRVTDNVGEYYDKQFSITIYGVLTFTTTALASGRRTFAYNQPINISGGAPTVALSLSSGPLPTGIMISGNALTGTPTQAGTFPITLKMTDALGNTATQNYSLVIADILTITSTTLPGGVFGVNYSQAVPTANGVGQVTFAITSGALPTSLTLNPATGLISGAPSATGPFTFTVQATDTLPITVSQQFTITIAPPPLITNISPSQLSVGQTQTVTLTGQNTNWDSTTTASFGAGVTVNSVTVTTNTSATANVTVQSGAAAGTRAVTLTTPDANNEVANLASGQTLTIIAAPPTISSLAPYGARKNTTASIAVTGQNLLGATFQFTNPIPNLTNVPGPINIVSNDGSNVVLSFPTGSAEGQYALSATTSIGSSPAIQFIVEPSGPQTAVALAASVLNIENTNWVTSTALPAGQNSYESLPASVLNINNPNWNTVITLPAGKNSYEALPVSVLNINNPNWNTVITLPAGSNSFEASPVSVLNVLWNSTNNYVLPAGRNFAMALPVAVCAPPQCTTNQTEVIVLHPPIATIASSAVFTPEAALAVTQPHLEPVEELDAVVEGRTLRLSAESLVSDLGIVSYEVNGVIVGRSIQAPHQLLFTVPAGVSDLAFRALVELPSGEGQSSQLAHVSVVPDPGAAVQMPEMRQGETATLYGSGLKAEFFAFTQSLAAPPALAGLTPQSTGYVTAVNQSNPQATFGDDPLGAGISHDFAARYSGEVWAASEGAYQFWVAATSGAVLRIDGNSVTQPVNLTRGWHKIEVEYFLVAGAESLLLEWQQPGAATQILGPDSLRTPLTGIPMSAVPQKFDSVWFEIQQKGQPARLVTARQDQ
jgi:hypothetical protein